MVQLKGLAAYMIQQSGSLVSLSQIQKNYGYKSITTLTKHLSYLVDSYLLIPLEGFSHKIKERSFISKKYYSIDVGMIRALNVKSQPDLGMRLETMIFIHLKQRYEEIYYLKSSLFDVDFVIKKQFKITELIQVCYNLNNEKTKNREIKSLIAAAKEFKVSNLKIITRDETEIISIENLKIHVIPAWKYLR